MEKFCNPNAIEINEEYASMILSSNPDLWKNTNIYENPKNEIIGFASIMKLPFYKDEWFVVYGILPEYFQSKLPAKLVDAIFNLGIKNSIPELYFQTTGIVSEPFDKKLNSLGFKPIHFYFAMGLDDFSVFQAPLIPKGISIINTDEIEDFKNVIFVINEAFKDSFLWNEIKVRKWRKMQENFKQNHIVEYGLAYENNNIVGFCNSYFNKKNSDIGYINTLGILPSHQHCGIGSALFASRVEFLQNNGCTEINLIVEAKNKGALQLYKRFGFYLKKNLTARTYKLI
jgi:ribosomal protein S18 acetylase RimI-like enzyme